MDGTPLTDQLTQALRDTLDKFGNQGLSLFEILGCLENLKLDVWVRHQHERYLDEWNGEGQSHG